ncbi:hypothetical protein [Streptomyces venezuelae]|uniref:hypothetical protein n=1 Tax=Streptomyces venezuelae TaxID=54571 RepID=UPI001681FBDF|nr:hypothetical protein [Streptomyces venezuelae]
MATAESDSSARPESNRSARHVVEHALVDYGYRPEVARELVDQLIAEGRET